MARSLLICAGVLVAASACVYTAPDSSSGMLLHLRNHARERVVRWDPAKTALIVCDMWDDHWCNGAARRVAELAGPMNDMISAARERGIFIIHGPSSVVSFYDGSPQRARAKAAPFAKSPVPLSESERWGTTWCWPDPKREPGMPIDDTDMGCDCDKKCTIREAWSRQIASIHIHPDDAITDNGQETYNLLAARGIDNVILCGVHLNMCVLGRPFGIRQMVNVGKNVVLMRDMTDTMYDHRRRPFVDHFAGTDLVVEHVERHWCPSITSTDITGETPFRFKEKAARPPRSDAPIERPNILLIVADDMGWNDIGYHNGKMRTPNLDRLAKAGIELDCHYVQPQCTPTRVALMTGRYPSRFNMRCTQASNDLAFPVGTPTMASMLKGAGYATGMSGKWHLGSKPKWGPNHHGFDHSHGSFAGAVGMYDHRYRIGSPFAVTWHRNHKLIKEEGHVTDLTTKETVRWIEAHDDAKKPWFFFVPFHAVHTPLVERDARWNAMNQHIKSDDRRLYASAVSHMDHAIGRMVDALERTGQRGRTIVVFTSDNGAQVNHGGGAYPPPDPKLKNFSSNKPLRGKKTDVYEGGYRVPALVSWPRVLSPRKVAQPMHAVDWVPTLAKLAGAAAPPGDGQDVWTHLATDAPDRERTFYIVWGTGRRRESLRHGDWKILRNKRNVPWELYDLARDPFETRNLAKKRPEKLAALTQVYAAQRAADAR